MNPHEAQKRLNLEQEALKHSTKDSLVTEKVSYSLSLRQSTQILLK